MNASQTQEEKAPTITIKDQSKLPYLLGNTKYFLKTDVFEYTMQRETDRQTDRKTDTETYTETEIQRN